MSSKYTRALTFQNLYQATNERLEAGVLAGRRDPYGRTISGYIYIYIYKDTHVLCVCIIIFIDPHGRTISGYVNDYNPTNNNDHTNT